MCKAAPTATGCEGFLVLSESAEFFYKTTEHYAPAHECYMAWNDAEIGIAWHLCQHGLTKSLLIKDLQGNRLHEA
jgi:dTDP-4-dehydrorhamnose 3,5-epimerase